MAIGDGVPPRLPSCYSSSFRTYASGGEVKVKPSKCFYIVVFLLAAGIGLSQTSPREPHTFLKSYIGFTDADLRTMEQGQVVAKVLETNNKTEVAVFGIVWINGPIDTFVRWQKDIERFEAGDAVQAIKKISNPPELSDFDNLTFPEDDLDALKKCKVGNCPVKIGTEGLTRLQSKVDWSAPDAHKQANRLIRQMFLEHTQEYMRNGDEALGEYRDKKRPTFLEKEFDGLLENSPYLIRYVPELNRFLDDYPNADLPGAEDFFYWSKVKFGLKPTVRLNHVVVYPYEVEGRKTVVIGSKMLYASHYFHTALELKVLVRDSTKPDAKGFYLISLNRSRSDGLTGLFGGIVRSKAQSEAQKGVASALNSAREALEGASQRRAAR